MARISKKAIKELNERYDVHGIPEWIIDKKCSNLAAIGVSYALAGEEKTYIAFERETEKALLCVWECEPLLADSPSNGEFWVPKSVLASN